MGSVLDDDGVDGTGGDVLAVEGAARVPLKAKDAWWRGTNSGTLVASGASVVGFGNNGNAVTSDNGSQNTGHGNLLVRG